MGLGLAHADRSAVDGFLTVERTRLHYLESGTGQPVVLLHGNGSMIGDFVSSGLVERIAAGHRVIAFDRPGFGYSERPRGCHWGPSEQARLLLRAFALMDIERPIVVGHSWGALVALALALEGAEKVAGLVLLSGYYYPLPRVRGNALLASTFPIVDDVLRQTVAPVVGRLIASDAVRRVFAPCAVPERFTRHYSISHALRPSQLKAVAEEAGMLRECARTFSELYRELSVPVRLIAGSDDQIVDTYGHSARLNRELGMSMLRILPGTGHMVHHAAPEEVTAAIDALSEEVREPNSCRDGVSRRWLFIDAGRDEAEEDLAGIEEHTYWRSATSAGTSPARAGGSSLLAAAVATGAAP